MPVSRPARVRSGPARRSCPVSKIVFICSESLIPVMLIVIVDAVGVGITGSPIAILL